MPTVFISYRRDDSAYVASMIRERLVEEFGAPSVFMDIDNIPLGVDFKSHIVEAVSKCDILLAIIGDHWLGPLPPTAARRIDDPNDFVRLEVETALARNISVVPVLIGKADMPKSGELPPSLQPLVSRNAAEVRSGRNLAADLDSLARGLRLHSRTTTRAQDEPGGRVEAEGRRGRQRRSSPQVVIAVVGALLAVVALSWRALNPVGRGCGRWPNCRRCPS